MRDDKDDFFHQFFYQPYLMLTEKFIYTDETGAKRVPIGILEERLTAMLCYMLDAKIISSFVLNFKENGWEVEYENEFHGKQKGFFDLPK